MAIRIIGKKAVLEAFQTGQNIQSLTLLDQGKRSDEIGAILALAKSQKVPFKFVRRHVLDAMEPDRNHQGIIAEVRAVELTQFNHFLAKKEDHQIVLALDHIQDPFNFGAMLRTAVSFGVKAVLFPKDRACGITEGVLKSGAGAASYMQFVQVTNLAESLKRCQKAGFWVYGTAMSGTQSLDKCSPATPLVLVMGNEHKGMSDRVTKLCDEVISIPMSGPLESLNVSVSCGILLYELTSNL